jgi:hypothetical protein
MPATQAQARPKPLTPGSEPTSATAAATPKQAAIAGLSHPPPGASFPHGVLSTEGLAPTVRKLPFMALGLVALSILLLALGALPASAVPHPVAAYLLAYRRRELAYGGLAILTASIAAYLIF